MRRFIAKLALIAALVWMLVTTGTIPKSYYIKYFDMAKFFQNEKIRQSYPSDRTVSSETALKYLFQTDNGNINMSTQGGGQAFYDLDGKGYFYSEGTLYQVTYENGKAKSQKISAVKVEDSKENNHAVLVSDGDYLYLLLGRTVYSIEPETMDVSLFYISSVSVDKLKKDREANWQAMYDLLCQDELSLEEYLDLAFNVSYGSILDWDPETKTAICSYLDCYDLYTYTLDENGLTCLPTYKVFMEYDDLSTRGYFCKYGKFYVADGQEFFVYPIGNEEPQYSFAKQYTNANGLNWMLDGNGVMNLLINRVELGTIIYGYDSTNDLLREKKLCYALAIRLPEADQNVFVQITSKGKCLGTFVK